MKIICAWCDKEMGEDDTKGDIRYSVCRDCLAKFNIRPVKEVETTPEANRNTSGRSEK
jgi:hypothetical protein